MLRTENVIVLRKAATSEMVSAVPIVAMPMIESLPQVARDGRGNPLASGEMVVIVALPRATDIQPANVPTRGVGPTVRTGNFTVGDWPGRWREQKASLGKDANGRERQGARSVWVNRAGS